MIPYIWRTETMQSQTKVNSYSIDWLFNTNQRLSLFLPFGYNCSQPPELNVEKGSLTIYLKKDKILNPPLLKSAEISIYGPDSRTCINGNITSHLAPNTDPDDCELSFSYTISSPHKIESITEIRASFYIEPFSNPSQ